GAINARQVRKQLAMRAPETGQYEALQPVATQHQALQSLQWRRVEPAQKRRPIAGGRVRLDAVRQHGPVKRGVGMVLGMIAIIEAEKVVDAPVVAGGPSRGVLPVPLQAAQAQSR